MKTMPEAKLAAAALRFAGRYGWNRLTPEAVARAAKLSPERVKRSYTTRDDLLPLIIRFIDQEMMKALGQAEITGVPKDRLFEIFMARIDVLQNHRRGILSLMEAFKQNPALCRRLLPAEMEAMRLVLKTAGLKQQGFLQPIVIAGLLGIYSLTLCTWQQDSSRDMSKTMAALDRHLRRASALAEILFREPT